MIGKFFRVPLVLGVLCLCYEVVHSQTLPVGSIGLEDWYRREQLLGRIDSTISFTIRPLTQEALQRTDIFSPDGDGQNALTTKDGHGVMRFMPLQWRNEITSTFPYSRNDGAMIPNVGYQTLMSAGVYLRYRFLSVQLNPEIVLAQNAPYQGYNGLVERSWRLWYSRIGNTIDQPERFGDGWYAKAFPGQSSVRLTFNPISVGLSTENLWWGPGVHNSLLMTNTAPGFPHLTLNTTRPIRTYIGSFEGQIIGARLEGSGYPPTPLGNPDHHDNYYKPKSDDWRYLSGVVLSYQPRWVKGLSLGFQRVFVGYHNNLGNSLKNYLPFFEPVNKGDYGTGSDSSSADEAVSRDQLISVFLRWLITDANAEVYFEYGRNDHSWDTRDLITQLEHSRSYNVGFRKLTPINWFSADDLLELHLEITQGEGPRDERIRPGGPWYRHAGVRHGYTHLGQMVGSGIGSGSNSQTLNVNWIQGVKRLGVQFERYVHNNDFFYVHNGDMRRNWVDFSFALLGEWNYQRFMARSHLNIIKAFNYQWELEDSRVSDNYWQFRNQDRVGFQFKVDLMYRF